MVNSLEKRDLVIYAVGYETRSNFVVQNIESQYFIGLKFPDCQHFSYQNNLKNAEDRNHELIESPLNGSILLAALRESLEKLKSAQSDERKITIALDVSSMSREFIFAVLSGLVELRPFFDISFSILYSTGQYKKPPEYSGAYTNFKPIDGLEGWTLYPERPLSVILGLGYETDQAVGVLENFDPSDAWAYTPLGEDEKFLNDTETANESLWNFLGDGKKQYYFVDQPQLLYAELFSLAEVLSKKSRVIIVPAGPKIFSAISILIGLELTGEVSLWRASYHDSHDPTDTLPAGKVIEFEYDLSRIAIEQVC